MVPAGVTLDLNGNTIEVAMAVLAYGNIIDTAATVGGIEIGADKIVHLQPNNAIQVDDKTHSYMPLYDTANGCYKFFEYEIEALSKNGTATSINLGVRILFTNREAYKVLAQGGTKVTLTLSITWNGKIVPIQHTVKEDSLKQYAKTAYNQTATGVVKTAVSVTITGLNAIAGKTLSVTANMDSTTNVSGAKAFEAYEVPQVVATTPEEN